MKNQLDIDNSHYVVRYLNGVRLLKPEFALFYSPHANSDSVTLGDLYSLPYFVYIHDKNSAMHSINDSLAAFFNAGSKKACTGKTAEYFFHRETAHQMMQHDKEIMTCKQFKFYEEPGNITDTEQKLAALSLKMPIYSENNHVIGLLGCTVLSERQSVPDFLTQLSHSGLLNHQKTYHHDIYLTKREMQIVELTIKGLSANKIGKLIYISQKTVEFHLENIKVKLGVKSKAELINKVVSKYLNT